VGTVLMNLNVQRQLSSNVLGVYLNRTCSRVTSASSALGVLNDYALYKSTHSRTHSLTHSRDGLGWTRSPHFAHLARGVPEIDAVSCEFTGESK